MAETDSTNWLYPPEHIYPTTMRPVTPTMTVDEALESWYELRHRAAHALAFDRDDVRLVGECAEPLVSHALTLM